jgi:hypothetical protein
VDEVNVSQMSASVAGYRIFEVMPGPPWAVNPERLAVRKQPAQFAGYFLPKPVSLRCERFGSAKSLDKVSSNVGPPAPARGLNASEHGTQVQGKAVIEAAWRGQPDDELELQLSGNSKLFLVLFLAQRSDDPSQRLPELPKRRVAEDKPVLLEWLCTAGKLKQVIREDPGHRHTSWHSTTPVQPLGGSWSRQA